MTIIETIDEMTIIIIIGMRDTEGCDIFFPSSSVEMEKMRCALDTPSASRSVYL